MLHTAALTGETAVGDGESGIGVEEVAWWGRHVAAGGNAAVVMFEVDEAVTVKQVEFCVEACRSDPQGLRGGADVEWFVVVVEGGGDVAEQAVAVGSEVVAPHAAAIAAVECPVLRREPPEREYKVVLVAPADVGERQAVWVETLRELVQSEAFRDRGWPLADGAASENLEVVAAAFAIDVSEHGGELEHLPQFVDADEKPAGNEGGGLGCTAVAGQLAVAEQQCGEPWGGLGQVGVVEAPCIIGPPRGEPDRDGLRRNSGRRQR